MARTTTAGWPPMWRPAGGAGDACRGWVGSGRPSAGAAEGRGDQSAPAAAPSQRLSAPAAASATTARPLRLGLVVPPQDASVNDRREMQIAAQQVIAAANANGGVAGQDVVLRVL